MVSQSSGTERCGTRLPIVYMHDLIRKETTTTEAWRVVDQDRKVLRSDINLMLFMSSIPRKVNHHRAIQYIKLSNNLKEKRVENKFGWYVKRDL